MSATVSIRHIATGSAAVTVSVLRTDGVLVSEHILHPGEAHNVAVADGQRIAIIQPAPPSAQGLRQRMPTSPPRLDAIDPRNGEQIAVIEGEQARG